MFHLTAEQMAKEPIDEVFLQLEIASLLSAKRNLKPAIMDAKAGAGFQT